MLAAAVSGSSLLGSRVRITWQFQGHLGGTQCGFHRAWLHVGGSLSPHLGQHLLVSGCEVLPHGGSDWPSLDDLRSNMFSCAVER